ncbi:MAG TPA: hypothetical protein PLU46_03315 [Thiotrichales bacterium]|nr:hypothetical protein [Thiotrichales bacterium]
MKIKLDFIDTLKSCLTQMGASLQRFNVDLTKPEGVNVDPSQIKVRGGLLSYEDYQVVVFIPDHSYKTVPVVLNNNAEGNRYHFAECKTIEDMRAKGRYERRYHASQNPDGLFEIFDSLENKASNVKLQPCQNCLKHINYQGFNQETSSGKKSVIRHFSIVDLLSTYSTWFRNLPSIQPKTAGYSEDWQQVSLNFRQKKAFTCEGCGVRLDQHKHLLHEHHIDGDKRNNYDHNLKALCIDCHRKEHLHDHMFISQEEMQLITQLRTQQGLIKVRSWQDAYLYADEAIHGVLKHYQAKSPSELPHVHYQLNGVLVDIAWPEKKMAIYGFIEKEAYERLVKSAWTLLSVTQALRS